MRRMLFSRHTHKNLPLRITKGNCFYYSGTIDDISWFTAEGFLLPTNIWDCLQN